MVFREEPDPDTFVPGLPDKPVDHRAFLVPPIGFKRNSRQRPKRATAQRDQATTTVWSHQDYHLPPPPLHLNALQQQTAERQKQLESDVRTEEARTLITAIRSLREEAANDIQVLPKGDQATYETLVAMLDRQKASMSLGEAYQLALAAGVDVGEVRDVLEVHRQVGLRLLPLLINASRRKRAITRRKHNVF